MPPDTLCSSGNIWAETGFTRLHVRTVPLDKVQRATEVRFSEGDVHFDKSDSRDDWYYAFCGLLPPEDYIWKRLNKELLLTTYDGWTAIFAARKTYSEHFLAEFFYKRSFNLLASGPSSIFYAIFDWWTVNITNNLESVSPELTTFTAYGGWG